MYNLRQVGHKLERERGSGGWENEEEEGLRVRCEFVGGANGSVSLTDSKPDELGVDGPPCSTGVRGDILNTAQLLRSFIRRDLGRP